MENVGLVTDLHLTTAAVALATVAGFVSLVPGGAVVREGVLAAALLLLLPQLGDLVALLSAIVLRLGVASGRTTDFSYPIFLLEGAVRHREITQ